MLSRLKASRTYVAVLGACAAVAVLAAGCGSSSSTSTNSSSGASAEAGSSSASTSGSASSGLAKATQIVEQAEAPVTTFTGPTNTPKPPHNKKILFVNPIAAAYGGQTQEHSVESAVKTLAPLGWTFTSINGKGNPTIYNEAILHGIALHVNGIVLGSISQQLVKGSLEKARKDGIDVVSQWEGNIGPSAEYVNAPEDKVGPDTVQMETRQPDQEEGRIKAAFAISQTKGKAHVFVLETPEYINESAKIKSFKATIAELCPECSIVQSQEVNEAEATTQVPQVVKAALQSHPEINIVYAPYDDVALLADQGVRESGRHLGEVEIVSSVGVPPAIEAICGGNSFLSGTIVEAPIWPGFGAVDSLIRLFDGQNPATPELFKAYTTPIRLVTKKDCSSIEKSPEKTGIEYNIPAAWAKVWGVG